MIAPRDAVLVIATRPRSKLLLQVLDFIHTTRARIVYLTDTLSAGSARRIARVVLPCYVMSRSAQASYTALVSVVQLLAATVGMKLGDHGRQRHEFIAEIHEEIEDLADPI